MNVADFILKFFSNRGVREVFLVTGGHAMYLNDALAKNTDLHYTCAHHEQTTTMAAEAYSRLTNLPAIAMVTAGPGSVNALNGVVGAWVDSAPLIVISGQSNLPIVEYQAKTGIRQFGVQGIAIKKMVEPVTKYFVTVDDPSRVAEYLQQAWEAVTTGRPGPVWLEVPLDIQRAEVPAELLKLLETLPIIKTKVEISDTLRQQVDDAYQLLLKAKRPLVIAGQGVHLANGRSEFLELVEKLRIPILTSRLGLDLITTDHPRYVGRPGTYGERSANFAIQNSDLILAIGSRLTISLTGHNVKDFGRHAGKILVDIDDKELSKPDLNVVLPIKSDAKVFLVALNERLAEESPLERREWVDFTQNLKHKYPVVLPEYKDETPVNSYYFTGRLTDLAPENTYLLVDTGSCFHVAAQTWKIKKGQRFLTTGGISTMGYWVAAMGVCLANNRQSTIVITGDGSLQMNLQELAMVKGNNLPLKIFIFNNNGYLLIRHTQRNFFERRMIGEGPESGVWCPDSLAIAKAYGIPAIRINSVDEVDAKIKEVLTMDGPVICDVMTPEWQLLIPRVSSEKGADGKLVSRAYEDMFPYLSSEELLSNMLEP